MTSNTKANDELSLKERLPSVYQFQAKSKDVKDNVDVIPTQFVDEHCFDKQRITELRSKVLMDIDAYTEEIYLTFGATDMGMLKATDEARRITKALGEEIREMFDEVK